MAPVEAILVVLLAQATASFDKLFAEVEHLDLARAAAANDEDAARLTLAMLMDYPNLFETSHCTDLMKELAALEDAVQAASGTAQAHTSEKIHELASRCER